MVTTRPPKTIVKPTALGPVANTDTKLMIYGLFQKGRVLAQDGEQKQILLALMIPLVGMGRSSILTRRVCGWFQHESSSPCYRSSGGLVDCLRLFESAASCGAASTADTMSSSPGSRYTAGEARRSSARSLRFGGRQACTPSGQPGPFQSPSLNRPVDRQAYRSCRPSSSRLPPRRTRPSNRPGGAALRCIPPSWKRGTSSASRACTGCAWDTSWSNITSATTIGRFRAQPRAVQQRRAGVQKRLLTSYWNRR